MEDLYCHICKIYDLCPECLYCTNPKIHPNNIHAENCSHYGETKQIINGILQDAIEDKKKFSQEDLEDWTKNICSTYNFDSSKKTQAIKHLKILVTSKGGYLGLIEAKILVEKFIPSIEEEINYSYMNEPKYKQTTDKKKEQKYKVYIWKHSEHNSGFGKEVINNNCNLSFSCWQLITSDITLSYSDLQDLFDKNTYPKEKFIIFARKSGNWKNYSNGAIYNYHPSLSKGFVIGLYKEVLAKKKGFGSYKELEKSLPKATKGYSTKYTLKSFYDKLYDDSYYPSTPFKEELEIVDPTKIWLIDSLHCKSFPARSQKIKGLREASSYLERLLDYSSIQNGIVLSKEENLEIKANNHDKYSCNGKRINLDQVIDNMLDKFTRPCPKSPEHGFVDSRLITTKEEALKIIEEIEKVGEIPEFIIMDRVDCEYSGVICPDMITFGLLNDGATQGNGAIEIKVNLPKEGEDEFRGRFWTNENKEEWPFAEVLYNGGNKGILVQLRSGPKLDNEVKKVRVIEVYEVDSGMDLIEWGKKSKELKEKVKEINSNETENGQDRQASLDSNINNMDSDSSNSRMYRTMDTPQDFRIEETIAIWHPNGALCSHFGVHCRTGSITLPYITSLEKPKIGEVIEIGLIGDIKLESIKEGLLLGLEAKINGNKNISKEWNKAINDLNSFLGSLHISSIADLGDEITAKYIGYCLGIGTRLISGLPFGEISHFNMIKGFDENLDKYNCDIIKDKIFSIIDKNSFPKNERDYQGIWNLPLDILLEGLIECDFTFTNYTWASNYGGIKWGNCTFSLLKVFSSIEKFIRENNIENFNGLVDNINIMVNEAHNGGWWLNKIGNKETFDLASILPHFLLSPKRAFEVRESKIGKFQMKLKEKEILKKLSLEGLKKIEEKRELERLERLEKKRLEEEKEKEKIEKHKKIMETELKKQKEELEKLEKLYKEVKEVNLETIKEIKFGIKGQFKSSQDSFNTPILHIQVKTPLKIKREGTREYGFAINIEVNKVEGDLLNNFYVSNKGSYLESLATKESFSYAPLFIYKGLKGECYLKVDDIVIKTKNKELYEILEELITL